MTLTEALLKCKELGFQIWNDAARTEFYIELSVENFGEKYGRIIYKNDNFVIHSHFWKKQDENISNVNVENWDKSLRNYIMFLKNRNIKNKLKDMDEDFV